MGKTIKAASHVTLTLIVFVTCFVLTSCTRNTPPFPRWLIGNWEAKVDGVLVKETWAKENNQIKGQTITYFDKYTQTEDMHLVIQHDTIFYNISLSNHTSCFTCGDPFNDTLIFYNITNDFPKRIVYTKPRKNKMLVWIDNFEGDPNRITYAFKKID